MAPVFKERVMLIAQNRDMVTARREMIRRAREIGLRVEAVHVRRRRISTEVELTVIGTERQIEALWDTGGSAFASSPSGDLRSLPLDILLDFAVRSVQKRRRERRRRRRQLARQALPEAVES